MNLLNAAVVHGYTIVTYQRPLKASDQYDLSIPVVGEQAILWSVGLLNERKEVAYHRKYTKGTRLLNFGRKPQWNCGGHPDSSMKMPIVNGEDDEHEVIVNHKPKPISNRNDRPQRKRPVPATPRPAAKEGAWEIPPIQCYEPADGVFYAQMGPTGGKQGYPAITGLKEER